MVSDELSEVLSVTEYLEETERGKKKRFLFVPQNDSFEELFTQASV